jgi:hypothetical protein
MGSTSELRRLVRASFSLSCSGSAIHKDPELREMTKKEPDESGTQ